MEKEGNVEYNENDVECNSAIHVTSGKEIHVSEAVLNPKDMYSCTDCKGDMRPVNRKIPRPSPYFRHEAKNVERGKIKCAIINRDFRHKEAQKRLAKLKKIKVPVLLKFPPQGSDPNSQPNILCESRYIEAAYAETELICYETDDGKPAWGKPVEAENKYHLIRADVVFFNKKKEIILLIEIVATHGITDEKAAKLSYLKYDTIQITIPKCKTEDIENYFHTTKQIEWIYNYEQENKTYVPTLSIPKGNKDVLLRISEQQRRISKRKSPYSCRKIEINNLIRSIRKCLRSKSYREIEDRFERELSRSKKNTNREKRELDELRAGIQKYVDSGFKHKRAKIETGRKELEDEEARLGRRYYNKKKKLEGEEGEFDREFASEFIELQGKIDKEFDEVRDGISIEFGETNTILYSIYNSERIKIEREGDRIQEKVIGELRPRGERLDIEYAEFDKRRTDQKELRRRREEIEREQEQVESETREDTEHREGLPVSFEQQENKINREQTGIEETKRGYRGLVRRIKNRDDSGDGELPKRIARIIQNGEILSNWGERMETITKYQKALQQIKNGDYKT